MQNHVVLQDRLGLAAEHGFFFRSPGATDWEARFGEADEQVQTCWLPCNLLSAIFGKSPGCRHPS